MNTKVVIEQEEAQAFMELLKDAKVPADMGYVLTTLKFKIFQGFKKEEEKLKAAEAKK
jgi:hypothetical protein